MAKITRQELMEILIGEGVTEELQQAIDAKELTQEERDRIFDFLEERDPEVADQKFAEILSSDIISKPTFDSGLEEKDSWKVLREDLAYEIRDLKQRELELEQRIQALNDSVEALYKAGKTDGDPNIKSILEAVDRESAELQRLSIAHSALALMHTEARTMEGQANARIFAESTEPIRGFLRDGYDTLTDFVKDMHRSARDMSKVQDLSFHPIESLGVSLRSKWANAQYKMMERTEHRLDKAEKKLLKAANKIQAREFRRDRFMDLVKNLSYGNGREVGKEEKLKEIKDPSKAAEYLKEHGYNERRLERMNNTIERLQEKVTTRSERLRNNLEHIQQIHADRLANMKSMAQTVYEHAQDSRFQSNFAMNNIARNLSEAYKDSFVQEGSLSKDLEKWARSHGYGDMFRDQYEKDKFNHEKDDKAQDPTQEGQDAGKANDGQQHSEEEFHLVMDDNGNVWKVPGPDPTQQLDLDNLGIEPEDQNIPLEELDNQEFNADYVPFDIIDGQQIMDGFDNQDLDQSALEDQGREIG